MGSKDEALKSKLTFGDNHEFDYLDIHQYIRVDTVYVVYEMNGELYEHSGTFESNKTRTKHQRDFHNESNNACYGKDERGHTDLSAPHTAQKCVFSVLISQAERTDLKKVTQWECEVKGQNIVKYTGHDLSKPEQRAEYLLGLDRERLKLVCGAEVFAETPEEMERAHRVKADIILI